MPDTSRATGGSEPRRYEIRVRGLIGPTMMQAFPTLAASRSGQDALLSGSLADQCALYGVIHELEALGLQLLEIRCPSLAMPGRPAQAHDQPSNDSSRLGDRQPLLHEMEGLDMNTLTQRQGRFAPALAGKVVTPEDAGFDEARRAWNLAVDQQPAAVVLPESAPDVAAAVGLAVEAGQRIAAQGTGHGAATLGPLGDAILVKTERMRGLAVDPVERIARAEAGVLSLELVRAAARHGLVSVAGSSRDVGVVGYTLGGGQSLPFGRRHGLAANSVRAIELVTADGRLVRADRDHEPDLFWALRGGGGSFGIVTAIELELVPLTHAYAGLLWYPIERAGEVLHAWAQLTQADPPDELATAGRFLNLPPVPELPEPVRGKSFVAVEAVQLGDPATADELLAPLRALGPVNDTIQTVPAPALLDLFLEPEHPAAVVGDGLLLAELPSAAIDALVNAAGAEAAVPLASVEVRHLEGELGRDRPGNGALSSLEAKYAIFAAGMTPTPELRDVVRGQIATVKQALAPWAARHMFLNLAGTSGPMDAFWAAPAVERLRAVKATVDPDNLIRANHTIPPAR
jgi:FAD/FMN-containing dehydrogenase